MMEIIDAKNEASMTHGTEEGKEDDEGKEGDDDTGGDEDLGGGSITIQILVLDLKIRRTKIQEPKRHRMYCTTWFKVYNHHKRPTLHSWLEQYP